jgi:hypothetical protein
MRRILTLTLSLGLISPVAIPQTQNADSSSAAQAATAAPDRASIDSLLGRYEKAYDHQNIDELVAVWPTVRDEKKQFQKIKDEFGRADVSEINVSMEAKQILPAGNGDFLVHCKRTEQYKKLETASYSSGDNMIGAMPQQNSGPTKLTEKKLIRKTAEAWVTLHNSGSAWTIASVSDKKPR